MSCLWILLFFISYVHTLILGEQGKTIEDEGLGHLSWASCHAAVPVPECCSAGSAWGSADPWQHSGWRQRAAPQPKPAPSTASNSWKMILWLFRISEQLLSIQARCWFLPESKGLSLPFQFLLYWKSQRLGFTTEAHYKGLINLSGLQIVSR